MTSTVSKKVSYSIGFALLAFFACYPLLVDAEKSYLVYFLYTTFVYAALAQGWNLTAGFTGQVSLGQHAFFGIGCYLTAILWRAKLIGYFDPTGMLLSGVGASLLAVAIGVPLLTKLRGDYFALGTLGLGEILRVVSVNGKSFTEGPAGISLPSSAYISMTPYYYIALGLAAATFAIVLFMTRSRVGLALIAIRDDETAAAANGVAVLKYKVLSFALGAFVTGVCGSLNAYYTFRIDPTVAFDLNWVIIPILMTILGGGGTVVGPVVGAFILSAVFELANIFMPQLHSIFSAVFIILVTLFLPDGIMSYVTGHKSWILHKLPIFRIVLQKP